LYVKHRNMRAYGWLEGNPHGSRYRHTVSWMLQQLPFGSEAGRVSKPSWMCFCREQPQYSCRHLNTSHPGLNKSHCWYINAHDIKIKAQYFTFNIIIVTVFCEAGWFGQYSDQATGCTTGFASWQGQGFLLILNELCFWTFQKHNSFNTNTPSSESYRNYWYSHALMTTTHIRIQLSAFLMRLPFTVWQMKYFLVSKSVEGMLHGNRGQWASLTILHLMDIHEKHQSWIQLYGYPPKCWKTFHQKVNITVVPAKQQEMHTLSCIEHGFFTLYASLLIRVFNS